MGSKKPKYYVVWVGKIPGIYRSWPSAQEQIKGYPAAKYKSFGSLGEAEQAYQMPWQEFYARKEAQGGGAMPRILTDEFLNEIEANSIAVDAACSGNPGKMEYRGVYTLAPEQVVFHSPVFPSGTNNIGEFLAIVHALALFHEKKPDLVIYTDSKIAQGWIKAKKCRTKLPRNHKTAKLWQVIARGETWLRTHTFKNKILKWETKRWGEIPADFGRK